MSEIGISADEINEEIFSLNGRMILVQAPTMARSIITAVLQFFPGQCLTPASAPATIQVILARMK